MRPPLPLVTVVIPARNEERDIAAAITSVIEQDYPLDRIEVVVVDGCSDDATQEVAKRSLDGVGFRRVAVVENPDRRTPSNLNRGLLWADGEVLVRVDARSRIPDGYIRRLTALLDDPAVAVAGGTQWAVPPHDSVAGRGIARALNNAFAMGLSRYRRRGAASGPTDTAYLGVFRVDDLRAVDGWAEHLDTNQDFDLNRRLAERGAVWFEAGLPVAYLPRSTVGQLFAQYRRFGHWKAASWRGRGARPRPRQLLLLAAPALLAGGATAVIWRAGARGAIALVGAAATGALAVDHVGSAGEPAPAAVRLAAIEANGAVAAGWLCGVLGELVRPSLDLRRFR